MSTTPNSLISPQGLGSNACVTTRLLATHGSCCGYYGHSSDSALQNPNGALVRRLTVKPRGTVSTQTIQYLFKSSDGGTTLNFVADVQTNTWTAGASTITPVTDFGFNFSTQVTLYAETGRRTLRW